MKFGKRLQSQLHETFPAWRDKYLSYKPLKQRLKMICAPECFTEAAFSSPVREEHDPSMKSVVDAAIEELERAQAGDAIGQRNLPACAARSAVAPVPESQNSSVNGIGTVTEDVTRKTSSGSAGSNSSCPKFEIEEIDIRKLTAEEVDFLNLLNAELEKFNTFFLQKEEEYVIRLQELKDRIEIVKKISETDGACLSKNGWNDEMIFIWKDIVNFHGEMVLLVNYSSLNYTGLVKILKKYDKRTGSVLRRPFIQNVLHQPFFTTELLSKLVRECEMNSQSLFPSFPAVSETQVNNANHHHPVSGSVEIEKETGKRKERDTASEKGMGLLTPIKEARLDMPGQSLFQGEDLEKIHRSTVDALRTIKELRRGSSTYSVFSLPPFCRSENESDAGDSSETSYGCEAMPYVQRSRREKRHYSHMCKDL